MPKVNHKELVMKAWAEAGLSNPPRTIESVLPFVNLVLFKIPAKEKAGYVKSGKGKENTIQLSDGQYVRVGRVMYSDGYMYKFMNDVPNGGPQWVTEETGENPHLYHPYNGPHGDGESESPTPLPPYPGSNLEHKIKLLETEIDKLHSKISNLEATVETRHQRMEAINDRFDKESKELNVHKSDTFIGSSRMFGGTVISSFKPRG